MAPKNDALAGWLEEAGLDTGKPPFLPAPFILLDNDPPLICKPKTPLFHFFQMDFPDGPLW
jgi:hypothetical protein